MIGERLEEARKSKSISIREAAEATKIRGEYLVAMEDNSFDIALPEIYIRGFLKNYANFLLIDSAKVLTDYDAQQLGKVVKPVTSPGDVDHSPPVRSSFGRMEIPQEDEKTESEADDSTSKKTPPPPTLESEGTSRNHENWADNKTLYAKIGVVLVGVLVLATILILLIQLITRDNSAAEINPEIAQPVETVRPETSAPSTNNAPVTSSQVDSISISATDSVTIIVEQTVDRKRLYSGTLNAGESISVEKIGPVSIRFTNGSALVVEKNGREFRPSENSVGRTVIE